MSKAKTKPPSLVSNDKKTKPVEPTPEPPKQESSGQLEVSEVSINLPFVPIVVGYVSRRCDMQMMTMEQAEKLQRLTNGLALQEETLKNGKPVKIGSDALKWILEQQGY